MSALPPDDIKGFGKAVRLSSTHAFASYTTRLQAGDPAYAIAQERLKKISLAAHGVMLLAFVLLSGWCGQTIGLAIVAPLGSFAQAAELFLSILITFLGAFAFMRLGQIGIRALLDRDDVMEWPRRDVDWGKQAFVFDRDGVAIAHRLVRRTYRWDSMAELTEDDVFVVQRKNGSEFIIPKVPADEDEMRERLLRGITLSKPVH